MASSDQIASNLKRIWEQKKRENKFTQVGAAKELGWTQSAISHYLNNHTEIGTQAVIKLANFLGVSATDIDPDILSELPDVKTLDYKFNLSDSTKSLKDKKLPFKISKKSFAIYCDEQQTIYGTDTHVAKHSYLEVEEVDPNVPLGKLECLLVKIKGRKGFKFCLSHNLPPGKITKKYRTIALRMPITFNVEDVIKK